MNSRRRSPVLIFFVGCIALGCGDSGHPLGQASGGHSGSTGGAGTGGTGGSAGQPGAGGGAGRGSGGAGGSATGGMGGIGNRGGAGGAGLGGTGGGAGQGAGGGGGRATGGGGGGGVAGQGGGGAAGQGAGGVAGQGAGGAAGAAACSSAPPVACPANQSCDYDTPNKCGLGSLVGRCVELPSNCPTTSNPVCGCDGTTYLNDCERQRARVQLDHTGSCTAASCDSCNAGQTYCSSYTPGTPGSPPVLTCAALPAACASAPSCACVCAALGVTCGSPTTCTCTESNGLVSLSCAGV